MPASLTAVAVVFVALFVGCSQPISPTSPTSVPSGVSSITASGGNATITGIPAEVVALRAAKEVLFKGRLEGGGTIVFEPPPSPFFLVELRATGNATHLGRFTVEGPHRVDSTTGLATGFFTFIAANGDTLTAPFTGVGIPTETPNIFSIVETATITGGTGRFAGATGSFRVERLVHFVTGVTTGSFEGTISSPGAQ